MSPLNSITTNLKITARFEVPRLYSACLQAKSIATEWRTEGLKLCKQTTRQGKRLNRLSSTRGQEDPVVEKDCLPTEHEGVAVFVIKDGRKVLLGRRKTSVCNDAFGLPGGHLEFGESFRECAAREVKEETGLDIENIKFLITTENFVADRTNFKIHIRCIFMHATLVDPLQVPQNLEPGKCGGWDWYDCDDLPEPLFRPLKTLLKGGFHPFTSISK